MTAADLRISKDVDPDPLVAGADATYSLTVTNAGPSDAQNVTITDTLDPALHRIDADQFAGQLRPDRSGRDCTVADPAGRRRRHGRHPGRRLTRATGPIANTAAVASEHPELPPTTTRRPSAHR